MKMSLFDKFLLALLLIAMLALSLFIGSIAVGVLSWASITDCMSGWATRWDVNAFLFGAAALLLFVIVIRLLIASYSGDRTHSYTKLASTESGEIAISIQTIKQIAAAFMATKAEVVASASAILPVKDGLLVRIKICVKEGINLPDITTTVQKELKVHLETVTGLNIKEIGVLVDNNRSNYSGKGK